MTSLNLQDISHQLDDVLVAEWVLGRIEDMQRIGSPAADQWIEELFPDTTVRRILKCGDQTIQTRLLRTLPHHCFQSHGAFLLEQWPQWHGNVAGWSAAMLARLKP